MNKIATTEETRRGDWMQTYSGGQIWPLDPRPGEISIDDIAAALGNICRFGGHCVQFYSVAQHSYLGADVVYRITNDERTALAFMLHDASEAYLGDIPRPLKLTECFVDYRDIEKTLQAVIFEKFNLTSQAALPIIKHVDDVMLMTEKRDLLCEGPDWSRWNTATPLEETIVPTTPYGARLNFLAAFNALWKKL